MKPTLPETTQQFIYFISFFAVPAPKTDPGNNLIAEEPGENQERTGGSFMKTSCSFRVLKYSELMVL
jgi:hypothetical protein